MIGDLPIHVLRHIGNCAVRLHSEDNEGQLFSSSMVSALGKDWISPPEHSFLNPDTRWLHEGRSPCQRRRYTAAFLASRTLGAEESDGSSALSAHTRHPCLLKLGYQMVTQPKSELKSNVWNPRFSPEFGGSVEAAHLVTFENLCGSLLIVTLVVVLLLFLIVVVV